MDFDGQWHAEENDQFFISFFVSLEDKFLKEFWKKLNGMVEMLEIFENFTTQFEIKKAIIICEHWRIINLLEEIDRIKCL